MLFAFKLKFSRLTISITTLWAYSADDKLIVCFLVFPRKQVLTYGDNLQEMSKPVFYDK